VSFIVTGQRLFVMPAWNQLERPLPHLAGVVVKLPTWRWSAMHLGVCPRRGPACLRCGRFLGGCTARISGAWPIAGRWPASGAQAGGTSVLLRQPGLPGSQLRRASRRADRAACPPKPATGPDADREGHGHGLWPDRGTARRAGQRGDAGQGDYSGDRDLGRIR